MAKSGRTKQKEADLEYSVAKQVEKMIRYKYENETFFFLVFTLIHHILFLTKKVTVFWEFKELDWEGNLPIYKDKC